MKTIDISERLQNFYRNINFINLIFSENLDNLQKIDITSSFNDDNNPDNYGIPLNIEIEKILFNELLTQIFKRITHEYFNNILETDLSILSTNSKISIITNGINTVNYFNIKGYEHEFYTDTISFNTLYKVAHNNFNNTDIYVDPYIKYNDNKKYVLIDKPFTITISPLIEISHKYNKIILSSYYNITVDKRKITNNTISIERIKKIKSLID